MTYHVAEGRTAFAGGTVVNSPEHAMDEGAIVSFALTNNRGTGEPDWLDFELIPSGN